MEYVIPQEVKDKIKSHLNSAIKEAISGFPSVYESEDTCTGDLFRLMKTKKTRSVEVDDEKWGGKWKWSIDYNKFGSGGINSTESILGFDGIFVLSIIRNGSIDEKTLLFQSKIEWRKKDIYDQCKKMLTWLGAATIINYTESSYETYKIEDVFNNLGVKPKEKNTLQKTLSEDFLNCNIGDFNLHYDTFQKELFWRDINNDYVSIKLNLNRKLKIKIEAPNKFPYETVKVNKEITNDEILYHRLEKGYSKFDVRYVWDKEKLESIKREFDKIFNLAKSHSLSAKENAIFSKIVNDFNCQFDSRMVYLKLEELKEILSNKSKSFADNLRNKIDAKTLSFLPNMLQDYFINDECKYRPEVISFFKTTEKELVKNFRNDIVKTFHPDKVGECSQEIKDFCEKITKNINAIS